MNSSDAVDVVFGLDIIQIVDVYIKTHFFTNIYRVHYTLLILTLFHAISVIEVAFFAKLNVNKTQSRKLVSVWGLGDVFTSYNLNLYF